MANYVQARGIFVDPARVRCPHNKARVENQIAYVRESWFSGESFRNLEDARSSAATWARDPAGCRIHGTTRKVPRDVFEEVEKAAMLAPPDSPFDVPLWTTAKVHPPDRCPGHACAKPTPCSRCATSSAGRGSASRKEIRRLIKAHGTQVE